MVRYRTGTVKDERKLMYRCALFYYKHGMNQAQIGDKLEITRQKVAEYLRRAREGGIVYIKAPRVFELESELIETLKLFDARVVMADKEQAEDSIREFLGSEAALYFTEKVKDGNKVGLSGGQTIGQMVKALASEKRKQIEVYPLSVGGGPEIVDISSNTLVGLMCINNPKAKGYALQSPTFALGSAEEAEKEKNSLLSRPDIKRVYEGAMNIEFGFTGIGCLASSGSTLVRTIQSLTNDPIGLIQKLEKDGAVGDINYQAFGIDGQIIDCELNKRVIAVPLEQLQLIAQGPTTHIVGIAGGHNKARAILGAINGKFVDILVTDEHTAEEVLQLT